MRNNIFTLFLIAGFSQVFGQEANQDCNLKDYYFPYDQLLKTKTYAFVNASDSSEKFYWSVQTIVNSGDTSMLIQVRDVKNRLTEEVSQHVGVNSVDMLSYKLYDYKDNDVELRDCKILAPMVYKWHQHPEDSTTWRVTYLDQKYSKPFELRRNRIFKKIDQERKLAKFTDFYYVKVGNTEILDHEVTSYYQQKRGLLKYTILYRNGITKLYTLVKESGE